MTLVTDVSVKRHIGKPALARVVTRVTLVTAGRLTCAHACTHVHPCAHASHASHASHHVACESDAACDAYARACVTLHHILLQEGKEGMGRKVVQIATVATPLEHARRQMVRFLLAAQRRRAIGLDPAAALEVAERWERRVMDLRRRRRPGPSRPAPHTGRYEREVAPGHGSGNS